MLHLSCVTPATAATSAPALRRGLHRARPPAPRQARNSRVSCCANAALPFCWSHCVCRLHADSEPRCARAHSGVAGWQGWGGGAGRCTVASSACRAGDHAAAAAPSCAHTPPKLAHALLLRLRVWHVCAVRCNQVLLCFDIVCAAPTARRGGRELARVAISIKTYEPGAHVGCSLCCSCSSKRGDTRVVALLAGDGDGGHACPDEGTG